MGNVLTLDYSTILSSRRSVAWQPSWGGYCSVEIIYVFGIRPELKIENMRFWFNKCCLNPKQYNHSAFYGVQIAI
jgi:hypothetical protein